MYYTYMLRCEDNSIYTGIASDLERRIKEHLEKDKKCAKYTSSHTVQKLESVWISEDRASASKLEYYIKKLTKKQKEEIIQNHKLPENWFKKLEINQYEYIEFDVNFKERP